MRPLTAIISAETGITEPLSTPSWQEGRLKRLAWGKYRDRQIFLTLSGAIPIVDMPINELRKEYDRMYDYAGEASGIAFYRVRHPPNYPDRGLPEIAAFSLSYRGLSYDCLAGGDRCSVTFPYRGSAVEFALRRDELGAAAGLMQRIQQLLETHRV